MKKNANLDKKYRVYRITVNELDGVEWVRERYFHTKEEAAEFVEYRKQHNPHHAKFAIVHKDKEEAFAQRMQEKFDEWLVYFNKKYNSQPRKPVSATDYNRGTPTYACRMAAHSYSFARATRIA